MNPLLFCRLSFLWILLLSWLPGGALAADPVPPPPARPRVVSVPDGMDNPKQVARHVQLRAGETAILVTGVPGVLTAIFGDSVEFTEKAPFAVMGLAEGVHDVVLRREGEVREQRIKAVIGVVVVLDASAVFSEEEFRAPERQKIEEEAWAKLQTQLAAVPGVANQLNLIEAFLRDRPEGWAAERAREKREELQKGYEVADTDNAAMSAAIDKEALARKRLQAAELKRSSPYGSPGRRLAGIILLAAAGGSFAGAAVFEVGAQHAAEGFHTARNDADPYLSNAWLRAAEGDQAGKIALMTTGITASATAAALLILDAQRTADWQKRKRATVKAEVMLLPHPQGLSLVGILP